MSDRVIWEGTEEERGALHVEANDEYQADLRNTWLFPSLGIAVIGLLLVVFGRRRINTEDGRT